ncbi:MAG: BON domain-containing protein [Thermodesulfovibrionales bacterium]
MKNVVLLSAVMVFGLVLFSGQTSTGETPGEYPDDSVITSEINALMVKDPDAHNFKIDATTIRGDVVLLGFIKSTEAEARLVARISEIRGVKSVKSLLTVENKDRKK